MRGRKPHRRGGHDGRASRPSCTDGNGDPLTYEIASQGTLGVASVVDGQLRYAAGPTGVGSRPVHLRRPRRQGWDVRAGGRERDGGAVRREHDHLDARAPRSGSAPPPPPTARSRARPRSPTTSRPRCSRRWHRSDRRSRARDVGAFVDATTPAQWVAGGRRGPTGRGEPAGRARRAAGEPRLRRCRAARHGRPRDRRDGHHGAVCQRGADGHARGTSRRSRSSSSTPTMPRPVPVLG